MSHKEMRAYMRAQLHELRQAMKKHIVATSAEWINRYANSFREIYNYKHLLMR